MSFGRHRTQPTTEEKKPVEKVEEKKPVVTQKKVISEIKKPVVLEGDIVIHKDAILKEEVNFIAKSRGKIKADLPQVKEVSTSINKDTIIKEEIKPLVKKKRVDKKEVNQLGLVGKTVVANDFRAIVTKRGEQINVVLTKILHDWNMANYNL